VRRTTDVVAFGDLRIGRRKTKTQQTCGGMLGASKLNEGVLSLVVEDLDPLNVTITAEQRIENVWGALLAEVSHQQHRVSRKVSR